MRSCHDNAALESFWHTLKVELIPPMAGTASLHRVRRPLNDLPLLLRLIAGAVLARQHHTLLAELAYLRAENAFYRRQLPAKRFTFTIAWRRRFAETGAAVGWARLKQICTVAAVGTIQHWNSLLKKRLLRVPAKQRGRPRTAAETERLVLMMSAENTGWGSIRISGELRKLGIRLNRATILDILRRNGITPTDRQRRGRESVWKPFIAERGLAIAATDFLTVDVWGWLGKRTAYVLFAIHIATRTVEILGVTEHPDEAFMKQVARSATMEGTGWLTRMGARYLIHDHDTKFCASFSHLLKLGGVDAIKLPPNSPNLNAFAERWVKSVKGECLRKITCLGFGGVRRALREYLAHYHAERPHQSLDNVPPTAGPPGRKIDEAAGSGRIACRTTCGGILKHHYREAA